MVEITEGLSEETQRAQEKIYDLMLKIEEEEEEQRCVMGHKSFCHLFSLLRLSLVSIFARSKNLSYPNN